MEFERHPRPHLWLNRDLDAWSENFRVLFYVLGMTYLQVAETDLGIDPDDPDRHDARFWAHQIENEYPRLAWP